MIEILYLCTQKLETGTAPQNDTPYFFRARMLCTLHSEIITINNNKLEQ